MNLELKYGVSARLNAVRPIKNHRRSNWHHIHQQYEKVDPFVVPDHLKFINMEVFEEGYSRIQKDIWYHPGPPSKKHPSLQYHMFLPSYNIKYLQSQENVDIYFDGTCFNPCVGYLQVNLEYF